MSNQQLIKHIPFDDLEVSTNTFIAITNIVFSDFDLLASVLPLTDYVIVAKKRGRKKKVAEPNPNSSIPPWSIITINTGVKCLGVNLRKVRKGEKTTKNWFRNSITIVMTTDMFDTDGEPKKINFKICKNGKFQMTGCKSVEYAEMCVQRVWECMKTTNVYTFSDKNDNNVFRCSFLPCMHNITFNLGVNINRELIDWFFKIYFGFSEKTKIKALLGEFIDSGDKDDKIDKILDKVVQQSMTTHEMVSVADVVSDMANVILPQSKRLEIEDIIQNKTIFSILETSIGYTGVNIKFQLKEDISTLPIRTRSYDDESDEWSPDITYIPYSKFTPITKKVSKNRYNTFLIFYSGKVILSGMCETYQRDVYDTFMGIVIENSKYFVETLSE
jgi:TATA-box binding protein (TBP) (component of TFIID and TFIIIB)